MSHDFYPLMKRCLWGVIGIFTALSGLYAVETFKILNDHYCGNSVLDPLGAILNWAAPIAFASSLGLVCLARTGIGGKWFAEISGIVVISITVCLVRFGIWYHAVHLGGHFEFSNEIWWL